jgi:acyl-coenzyme A thioesterase PaaI-like protein
VNLVRPITSQTGRVRAEGRLIHAGRRAATAEGRLVALDTGKLLAHGTTTCMIS